MMQPNAALASQRTRLKIEFAQATDPGRDPNKQVNEDACGYVETKFGHLCVLCDGMGGHYGGKEASRCAITTIFEVMDATAATFTPSQALKTAVEEAGRRVYRLGGAPDNRARPGSTVVVMLLHDRGIDVAHVGDSRAYVIRQNQIYPLTRDHSMVQGMIDAGMLTEEQAMGHPDSNKITRALGMRPEVEVELRPEAMELFPGDVLISASDGLTDLAFGHDILGCTRQALASGNAQHACNMLVQMANDRGGHDNITVQIARVLEVGPKTTTIPEAPSPMGPRTPAAPAVEETANMTKVGPSRAPHASPQPSPAAPVIQQPPTADWYPPPQADHTEMGTEIMMPVRTVNDYAPSSARYGASANGPQPAQPTQAGVAPRLAPTQGFEAFRVEATASTLPLPPPSGRRPGLVPVGTPGGGIGAGPASSPYAAVPFVPLSTTAAGSARGGIVFIIIGSAAAIAIVLLIGLWAVLR